MIFFFSQRTDSVASGFLAVDVKKIARERREREKKSDEERTREREKIGEQNKTEEVGASTDAKKRGLCPTMQTIEGKEEKNARKKHVRTLAECHSTPKTPDTEYTIISGRSVQNHTNTQSTRRISGRSTESRAASKNDKEQQNMTKKDNQKEIRSKELIYIYLFITYAHANDREIIFVRRKSTFVSLPFSLLL